jgi:hypothetical protein
MGLDYIVRIADIRLKFVSALHPLRDAGQSGGHPSMSNKLDPINTLNLCAAQLREPRSALAVCTIGAPERNQISS